MGLLKDIGNFLFPPAKPFDPAALKDPIALKTDWHPIAKGGNRLKAHQLHEVSNKKIEFKRESFYSVTSWAPMVIGTGICALFIAQMEDYSMNPQWMGPITILVISWAFGLYLMYKTSQVSVFDKERGYFHQTKKSIPFFGKNKNASYGFELSNIHAVQIVPEIIKTNKNSYTSYEINLVLKNGTRKNITDHGAEYDIREDARELAEFLNVPLWDASEFDPTDKPYYS